MEYKEVLFKDTKLKVGDVFTQQQLYRLLIFHNGIYDTEEFFKALSEKTFYLNCNDDEEIEMKLYIDLDDVNTLEIVSLKPTSEMED